MRPCRARARMHVNLQKIPQWLYNWDMLVDVMRGCLNKKRLLMIYFGLKGRVELQQYYSWYIFYRWIRRKFFLGTLRIQSKSCVEKFRNLKQSLLVIFEMKTQLLLKFGSWVYQLFLYESFWIIVLLMQRKSHAKKLSIPSRIGTARLDGK